ncbi:MAG: M23 family metallopeptidase [Bdellovibrio sp.]|nr:M23 family metallopeptidase [Bdellovibrio sp.]
MSKFSNLLVYSGLVIFLAGCATSSKSSDYVEQSVSGDEVHVDKKSNSIKVTPDSNSEKKTAKVKRKPQFDWPVWEARMTRGYLPRGKGRRKRPHKGIDLAAPRGSAVMAAHDGTIIYTGSGFRGYGKMIMIESNDSAGGWATLYGHLDKIVVYEGKKIRQGEVIGALGNTGRSSGPHLHFEIRQLNGPIDPLPLLPAGEALTNDVDNGAVEE